MREIAKEGRGVIVLIREPLTVVLMGSDTREGKGNGGFGSASEIGGARSDTTIVMHIAGDRKSAIGVSIPRDTIITLPQCKKDGKKVAPSFALAENADILAAVANLPAPPYCVGFAAESEKLLEHARDKLRRKKLPLK